MTSVTKALPACRPIAAAQTAFMSHLRAPATQPHLLAQQLLLRLAWRRNNSVGRFFLLLGLTVGWLCLAEDAAPAIPEQSLPDTIAWHWTQQIVPLPTEAEQQRHRQWAATLATQVERLEAYDPDDVALAALLARRDLPDLKQDLFAARLAAGERVVRGELQHLKDGSVLLDGLTLSQDPEQQTALPASPPATSLSDGVLVIEAKTWRAHYRADTTNPLAYVIAPAEESLWHLVSGLPGLPLLVEIDSGERLTLISEK